MIYFETTLASLVATKLAYNFLTHGSFPRAMRTKLSLRMNSLLRIEGICLVMKMRVLICSIKNTPEK